MPNKCCVTNCKTGYSGFKQKLSLFAFPKEPARSEIWLKEINRKYYNLTKNSFICEKHFEERFIVREDSAIRDDGTVLTIKRQIPKLTPDAFPTIFPDEPYIAENILSKTKTPSQRKDEYKQIKMAAEIQSREEVPGVATTLQLLPEQTEEPFLGVVNKPRSYKKGSDKTYCRFCLQSSGKNTSTPLAVVDLNYPGKSDVFRKKKMEKVEEINKMLRFCLPFYDSLTFNPVICSICLGRLKVAYEFSKQCFKNQQLIEKYADTYSATERVINLNEMIETKFKLPDDGNMSESETFSDIPQVTRTSNRISQKRKYPNYNDPPLKKRKACSETYEDDSTNSSDNTSNIKIEPDDDDNSGLMESLKMELDDEDNSFGFTERTLDDVPQSYNISEEGIKVEPNYIDCPDFIKSEQVDDLHEEHKVFDERTGIGTDSERQQLYSQGLGNVSVATKNDPLFVKEPSFSTVGTGLEDSTDD